jgi:hypothetical protein
MSLFIELRRVSRVAKRGTSRALKGSQPTMMMAMTGRQGGLGVRRISTTTHSNNRHVRPPTYHFKRLLMEACPNHAYPSGISSKTVA